MLATTALLGTAVIGGVAYTLVKQDDGATPAPIVPRPPNYSGGGGTAQPGSTVKQMTGVRINATHVQFSNFPSRAALGGMPLVTQKATAWPSDLNLDPELQKKFGLIEAATKKAFDDANEVAKAKAAEYLNKELKLDPPLTGHEDWKAVGAVVGGVAGGAIGGYLGGPLGAKLGSLVGAYLGTKLADLLAKNWEELKAWVSETWGDVKEWVSDTAGDVYDEVSGWVSF